VALFKPQFEAARDEVGRGGVIRDPQMHARLIGRFAAWCVKNGLRIRGLTASPLLGPAGNREFFFNLRPVRQAQGREGGP
jgi:23S rRNA (cytidine1920-2'-O)/16S rRNA (cytidine1409-2'-O)-methyltransferase